MPAYIYACGICDLSVCVPAKWKVPRIEREVNAQSPTGIRKWRVSKALIFKGGEPNPCQCSLEAERLHYLMVC